MATTVYEKEKLQWRPRETSAVLISQASQIGDFKIITSCLVLSWSYFIWVHCFLFACRLLLNPAFHYAFHYLGRLTEKHFGAVGTI